VVSFTPREIALAIHCIGSWVALRHNTVAVKRKISQTKRRNGNMPMGYLGQVVLRREQCDMMTAEESHCLATAQ
jgi:hypothetical protein